MTFTLVQTVRKVSRPLSSFLALTVALSGGAVLVGVSPAQAGRRDEKDKPAYTIKRVYKAGDVDRYRIGVKIIMESAENPLHMVETMVMKETIKEASEDGAAVVASEFEHATMNLNGMEMEISAMMPKIIMLRDKDGKTEVKTEGGNADAMGDMKDQIKEMTNFSAVYLPPKQTKVGDSWEVNATGLGPPDAHAKGKGTLVSVETVKGMKVGKIKVITERVDEMNNQVHGDTLILIDMATGKTLDLISKLAGDSPEGKISMEMTQRMIDPNAKEDGSGAFKP